MKRKLGIRSIFMLLFSFSFLFAANIKAEAAQTVTKGSYTYFAEDGTIYKMNSKSGKISKVARLKRSNTVEVAAVKGSWLYLTVDDYYSMRGTDNSWSYICRIKTNGKGLETLAKGENPVLYGNYIYYEGKSFNRKTSSMPQYAKHAGIYRMRLDGKGRRRLCVQDKCSWLKIYKKRIYFGAYLNERSGIYSVNLSGKDFKTHVYSNTPKAPYFTGNKMYFGHGGSYNANDIYVYNLVTGDLTRLRSGEMLTAYNGEIYYFTGSYGRYTLYRYRISNGKSRKICTRQIIRNVIGGKKWVIVNYYRGNKRHNIGVDRIRLDGKGRKTITTYFRS